MRCLVFALGSLKCSNFIVNLVEVSFYVVFSARHVITFVTLHRIRFVINTHSIRVHRFILHIRTNEWNKAQHIIPTFKSKDCHSITTYVEMKYASLNEWDALFRICIRGNEMLSFYCEPRWCVLLRRIFFLSRIHNCHTTPNEVCYQHSVHNQWKAV